MKKQMSWFVSAAMLFGMSPVCGAMANVRAASSADLTNGPATRQTANVNYNKYTTRTTKKSTYSSADGRNIYYTQPAKRSELYKQYDTGSGAVTSRTSTVRTSRAETLRSEMKRKYYLAHPFFQPLKGKFGSVTDVAYNMSSYDLKINQTLPVAGELPLNGISGKWDMGQITVKEDFSYGITDQIAVMLMAQYDSSTYKFKWDDGAPTDKMDDSGINMFGVGAQWRALDNDKWIATASAYYQHQKDIANSAILDIKAGYKVPRSTIYALARGWYVDFDGNTYGNGVATDESMMYVAYKTNVDNAFYIEGGVGVFSVLDEDWTLNLEAVFGNYDWHNQASIKGAIGWQPGDWFALNLYVKTAFYDSANDKNLDLYWREPAVGLNSLTPIGTVKLDNYSETSIGLQGILYF